jgi:molecular chaperone DnaK
MASLKTKLDALEQAAQAMAQQMYQNPNANAGGADYAGGGSASGSNDDVVDADFTEKN